MEIYFLIKCSHWMRVLVLCCVTFLGCFSSKERLEYEELKVYEGRYEYIEGTTLDIIASPLDTSLYAVIDKAKYPLKYVGLDSFLNMQGDPVVFIRNDAKQLVGYEVGGMPFKLISKDFEKLEMLPRRNLFRGSEKYTYVVPEEIDDGLKSGNLHDAFSHPELIEEMIRETIEGVFPDVHSILIYKSGQLLLEEYFYGYDRDEPHQLRSATKPFIGGLVGIAIDQGFIKSEKDELLPFFETAYRNIELLDHRKEKLTLEDFLTYRHGMDCENNNPQSKGNEQAMMQSKDWVKYTLDLPMISSPGVTTSYCTGCALTLGSLVELVSGQKLEQFAKNHLFTPLGISNYQWNFAPDQRSMTSYSQMHLTPRDLLKLAKMYHDGGIWEGAQIISKDWIQKTFKRSNGNYGYLWQHKFFELEGKRYDSYLATGNGGQKINIWPDLNMITVFTGGNYNSYQLHGKSTPPNQMIPQYILRAL